MTGFDPPTHMPSLRKLVTDGHDFMVALARKQIWRRSAKGGNRGGGGGEEAAAAKTAPPERAETGERPRPMWLGGANSVTLGDRATGEDPTDGTSAPFVTRQSRESSVRDTNAPWSWGD